MTLRFVLNGEPVELSQVEPELSLLAWLRARGLTGSKEGCAEGECGACAVALLEPGSASAPARYTAVNGCLLPVSLLHGREVWSVEGVAEPDGSLHPVQAAMVEAGGSQCGYCTPGFVVSMFCEYYRPERRARCDPEAIAGNLCRCTGYRPILSALSSLGLPAAQDPRQPRPLGSTSAQAPSMPLTLSAFFAQRAEQPNKLAIAGGTDLMVEVNQRGRRLSPLVSLERIDALSELSVTETELTVGAALPLQTLARRLEGVPLPRALRQLFPLFASPLIRARATLGGNLATASPIGDAAPVLLALRASLTLVGPHGTRRLQLADFFVGYRKTALAPDELIQCIHVPLPGAQVTRFYKASKRVSDDISTVCAGLALSRDAEGRVSRLRVGLGGVAATPVRALNVEQAAQGMLWGEALADELARALSEEGTPLDDPRGSAAYRRAVLAGLMRKFFADSVAADAAALEVAP